MFFFLNISFLVFRQIDIEKELDHKKIVGIII